MNAWTRPQLISLIAELQKAYSESTVGKSYTIQGRTRVFHSLEELRKEINALNNELTALVNGRRGSLRVQMRVRR